MSRTCTPLVLMLGVLTGCGDELASQYSGAPIEGWVVEENSKSPMEGVIVVAHWPLKGGFRGNKSKTLHVAETVTDADGYYSFPAWGPLKRPRGMWFRDSVPNLIFFKAGHYPSFRGNEVTPTRPTYSLFESYWDGKTVEIEGKPSDLISYKLSLSTAVVYRLDDTWQDCLWKNIPRTIDALRQEDQRIQSRGPGQLGFRISFVLGPAPVAEDPYGAREFWERTAIR